MPTPVLNHPLRGKRYINLIRCSTQGQKENSVPAQLRLNNEYAKSIGMIHVKDIVLEGVSGSKTFNRRDLRALLDEKQQNDSYDVLLVRDLARLTRGGISHGHATKRQFRQVGVVLNSVLDRIPDGANGELFESFLFHQSKEFAMYLARTVVPELINSVKTRRKPPCNRPPYGFDRLLMGVDGKPSRLVRRGTHERTITDYRTGAILQVVPNSLPWGKEQYETYRLVLGDPHRVETVRWMFKQFYVLGNTISGITRELNQKGIPAANGGHWRPNSVYAVLTNPTMLGDMVAFRTTSAIYQGCSAEGAFASFIDQAQLEGKGLLTVPAIRLPEKHWHRYQDDETSKMIVDPEVRVRAEAGIKEILANWMKPRRRRVPGHGPRNPQSSYFLKGVLNFKHVAYPVSGRTTGQRDGTSVRYYTTTKFGAYWEAKVAKTAMKMARADALEQMAWSMAREAFGDLEFVRKSVEAHARRCVAERRGNDDIKKLSLEEKKLNLRLRFIMDSLEEETARSFEADLSSIQARLREIRSLKMAGEVGKLQPQPEDDVAVVTKRVMSYLRNLPSGTQDGSVYEPLRRFMATIFSKLEIDMETFEVSAEIVVPEWAMKKNGQLGQLNPNEFAGATGVCAMKTVDPNNSHGAQPKSRLFSAVFEGKYLTRNRKNRREPFTFHRVRHR